MEGRERREEVGTGDGRDMGSREVGEQTLGSPVSQRVEVWIGSGVCTGHLVGRTVLKETKGPTQVSVAMDWFPNLWACISLAMKCGDSGPFVQTQ